MSSAGSSTPTPVADHERARPNSRSSRDSPEAPESQNRTSGYGPDGRGRSAHWRCSEPPTASSTIDRNVALVSATVFAAREPSSWDCQVATCSVRRLPILTSPSEAVIRSTRSTYLPSDDGRTRMDATVCSHHDASARVNASARRRKASSRVLPRTRRGPISPPMTRSADRELPGVTARVTLLRAPHDGLAGTLRYGQTQGGEGVGFRRRVSSAANVLVSGICLAPMGVTPGVTPVTSRSGSSVDFTPPARVGLEAHTTIRRSIRLELVPASSRPGCSSLPAPATCWFSPHQFSSIPVESRRAEDLVRTNPSARSGFRAVPRTVLNMGPPARGQLVEAVILRRGDSELTNKEDQGILERDPGRGHVHLVERSREPAEPRFEMHVWLSYVALSGRMPVERDDGRPRRIIAIVADNVIGVPGGGHPVRPVVRVLDHSILERGDDLLNPSVSRGSPLLNSVFSVLPVPRRVLRQAHLRLQWPRPFRPT